MNETAIPIDNVKTNRRNRYYNFTVFLWRVINDQSILGQSLCQYACLSSLNADTHVSHKEEKPELL
jgi:hypothetical protein